MPMKQTALAALMCLAASAPSQAQMTDSSCAVSWGLISNLLALPQDVAPALEEATCVARDLEFPNGQIRILVDELRWSFEGLEALLATGAFLERAEIHARGVYLSASTGLPDFDYMIEAQARATEGISVDLLASYSEGQVRLDHLLLDFPGENAITARLQLDNVDPRHPESAVLSGMRLEVLSRGLFEAYALMPLGNMFLNSSDDPEARVAELQAEAIDMIDTLPEPLFQMGTRQALTMLVQDLPNPAGLVTLDLHYEDGLPITQLSSAIGPYAPILSADPMLLLQGADLQITYDRYGAE